jgi:serine/threonine protein phosphatase PrpC
MWKLIACLFSNSQLIKDYVIDVMLGCDKGCQRITNEDQVQFFCLPENPKTALAVVADGMGGHNAGDIASRKAVQILGELFLSGTKIKPLKFLKSGLLQANSQILSAANLHPEWLGMGTTVTACLITKGKAYFGHVGDSRLYFYRDNKLEQMTSDHTLVADLVRSGHLSPEDAQKHPDRNIVTRAIGTKPLIESDINVHEWLIRIGDIYLLCSDGLYDLVSDSDIQIILQTKELSSACQRLIDLAKSRGGYDNISVILIAIKTPQPVFNLPVTRI